MKLESVTIKRFRSIENATLTNCGGFNVLIGKNNSGKSNILSAIDAFFNCIQDGNVVTLNPPISREIDFFERKAQLPIEVTLTFSLLLAERDALIRDIVTEAQQMKNAVDGIDPSLRLSATLNITPPPNSFSFVKKIVLGGTVKPGAKHPDPESNIFSIGDDAALELFDRFVRSNHENKDAEALIGMDSDDLRLIQRYIRDESLERSPVNFFLRRSLSREVSEELVKALRSRGEESASSEYLKSTLQTIASRKKEEAIAIQEEPLKNKVGTFAGEESSIPNYVQNLLNRMAEIKVLHLKERRKDIGKEEAERFLSLKVGRGMENDFLNIKETVSSLLGVKIDVFWDRLSSGKSEIPAELDVDNFLVEVNGSGVREALRLILDFEFEHPHILLIEEPETHLHPALETSMMQYLKRIASNCQVFTTTHSTNFLDTAEMKNVYLVSKPDSTQVQQLDVEEAESQIPKELGIRLSSLFMFDRLVFVEGQSDEDILRKWASTLKVNFSQVNVGFIHMGGVRNFAHFAAQTTLSFLTKRQVKMWFLMDRDEKDDFEVSKLQQSLGEKAVVKILKKREVENYLVYPRLIKEFIKSKKESMGNKSIEELPTELDIHNAVEECAERLKQFAIDKRVAKILCKPIYPSFKQVFEENQGTVVTNRVAEEIQRMIEQLEQDKEKVEGVYKEKSEEINSLWSHSKLNIVPGDLLLDMVCQHYGVRFKKERDGARIAALMSKDEIDEEIKGIIREIGS